MRVKVKCLADDGEVTYGRFYIGELDEGGDVEITNDQGEESYLFEGEYEVID